MQPDQLGCGRPDVELAVIAPVNDARADIKRALELTEADSHFVQRAAPRPVRQHAPPVVGRITLGAGFPDLEAIAGVHRAGIQMVVECRHLEHREIGRVTKALAGDRTPLPGARV